MVESQPTDFRPRWFREAAAEILESAEFDPCIGEIPLVFPRLMTRIIPSGSSAALPAKALSEIIAHLQKIANYAAYDVTYGVNPEFADLRSMGHDLFKLSALTVEPFEEGSFVILARLESPALQRTDGRKEEVTTDHVVKRLHEVFSILSKPTNVQTTSISLGALQTIDTINRTLDKVDADLELSTRDSYSQPFPTVRADREYRANVTQVLRHRRPTSQTLSELEGKVTMLDIMQGKIMLSVAGEADRISGNFPTTLHPKLLDSLGRRVRLFGLIETEKGKPIRINVHDSEFVDDE